MNSKMGKEMLQDFMKSALDQIGEEAFHRADLLRLHASEQPHGLGDAARFEALGNAIASLWPNEDAA